MSSCFLVPARILNFVIVFVFVVVIVVVVVVVVGGRAVLARAACCPFQTV